MLRALAGSAIRLKLTCRNPDTFVLYDPDAIRISVYDPNGAVKVNDAPMVKLSLGIYTYQFQTTNAWLNGEYLCIPEVDVGDYTALLGEHPFDLWGGVDG